MQSHELTHPKVSNISSHIYTPIYNQSTATDLAFNNTAPDTSAKVG